MPPTKVPHHLAGVTRRLVRSIVWNAEEAMQARLVSPLRVCHAEIWASPGLRPAERVNSKVVPNPGRDIPKLPDIPLVFGDPEICKRRSQFFPVLKDYLIGFAYHMETLFNRRAGHSLASQRANFNGGCVAQNSRARFINSMFSVGLSVANTIRLAPSLPA